jgi:hypothetical protein
MTAKDFVKNRTPRDPRKLETWFAAALQGGGAGIYGDFLFGKASRFGSDFLETVAGPTGSTIGDVHRIAQGLTRGEMDAGQAFYLLQNNTPFINLWYTRGALDLLVLYNLQEMLSPGTLGRRQRRMWQEYGQEFIVPPSEIVPYGGGGPLEPAVNLLEEVVG